MNQLAKPGELSSIPEKGKKTESGSRPGTSTGSTPTPTPKPVAEKESTGGISKHSPKPIEEDLASTRRILAVWQTDFFDLQSRGFKVAILAANNVLYASIELPDHVLDTGKTDTGKDQILLDGLPVSEG